MSMRSARSLPEQVDRHGQHVLRKLFRAQHASQEGADSDSSSSGSEETEPCLLEEIYSHWPDANIAAEWAHRTRIPQGATEEEDDDGARPDLHFSLLSDPAEGDGDRDGCWHFFGPVQHHAQCTGAGEREDQKSARAPTPARSLAAPLPRERSQRAKMAGGCTSVSAAAAGSLLLEDDWHVYDLKRMDPLSCSLWFIACYSDLFYATIPDYILRIVPHSGTLLSMCALFFFTQALALLWGFLSIALSVMCTRAVQQLDKCDLLVALSIPWPPQPVQNDMAHSGLGAWQQAGANGHAAAGGNGSASAGGGGSAVVGSVPSLVYTATRLYMNFAVLQLCWFVGSSLFEIGWEMYGDFPRVRVLLDPQHYSFPVRRHSPASGSADRGSLPDAEQQRRRKARRVARRVGKIFLIAPLAVLLCLSLSLLLVPVLGVLLKGGVGEGRGGLGGEEEAQQSGSLLGMVEDDSSRLSRTLRVCILICLVQWGQQFHCHFPRWYNSLNLTWGAFFVKWWLVLLTPASGYRLLEWISCPSQSSALTPLLNGIPYQIIDNALVSLWSLLCIVASCVVLNLNGPNLKAVGWRNDKFTAAHLWFRQSLRFKLTLVLPVLLHFIRGVLSTTHGFSFAQKDTMLISVLYPLILTVIWTTAYCSAILKVGDLLLVPLLALISYVLCAHLGQVQAKGVMLAVALHMGRALVKRKAQGSALQRAQKAPMESLLDARRFLAGIKTAHTYNTPAVSSPHTRSHSRLDPSPTHAAIAGSAAAAGTASPAVGVVSGASGKGGWSANASGVDGDVSAAGAYLSSGRLLEMREQTNPQIALLRAGRRTFGESRDIAAGISRMYLASAAAFACTMLCLGVLSVLQCETRWYPSASAFIQLRTIAEHNVTKAPATQISHAISLLHLHHRPPPPPPPGKWGLWRGGEASSGSTGTANVRAAVAKEQTRRDARGDGAEEKGDAGGVSRMKSEAWTLGRTSAVDSRYGWRRGGEFAKTEYAICQAQFWGLSPLDYGMLSLASYFEPSELERVMPLLFPADKGMRPPNVVPYAYAPHRAAASGASDDGQPPRPARGRGVAGPDALRQGVRGGARAPLAGEEENVFWTEFEFPDRNVTVVSLRGTQFWRVSDWLEDVRMWTEPVVFSILSVVFPTIRAWSPHTTAMVLDTFHALLDSMGLPDPEYKYQGLVRYIKNVIIPRLPPHHELVLTGHSLGGGIAHITAALLNLPVVAFSPPGAYQSISKHLYWNAKERRQMHDAAHNRTVTFLPENDMMGHMFDSHGGLVQTMTCNTDHLGPVGCHLLENTICNLISHCGNDPRWHSCDFAYQARPLFNEWLDIMNETRVQNTSTRTLCMAALTITLYLTATTLSVRWVWANL